MDIKLERSHVSYCSACLALGACSAVSEARRSLQRSAKPDFPCVVRLSGATLPQSFSSLAKPGFPCPCESSVYIVLCPAAREMSRGDGEKEARRNTYTVSGQSIVIGASVSEPLPSNSTCPLSIYIPVECLAL